MAQAAGYRVSIPISIAPAAKTALVDMLTACLDQDPTTGDPVVGVSRNEPGEYLPDDLAIVGKINRTFRPSRMIGGGGTGWGDEDLTVDVELTAFRGGDQPQATEERVWHMVALFDQALRADPSLGGLALLVYMESVDVECEWTENPSGTNGWVAWATCKVHIEASQ